MFEANPSRDSTASFACELEVSIIDRAKIFSLNGYE